ncbi:MAG: YiaA/YiaB family inner membrane protein [Hyphomicrobium sp.]
MTSNANTQNTGAWLTFTYVSFATSLAMMAVGIYALPADLWVKGYLTMAGVFMLGSSFTLSKTVRDEHEAKRFSNRIEDAKAERLLMEVGRAA